MKKLERKLKDGCAAMDLADRKNKITKILIAARYPSENEFNGSVESFAKSNLKIEKIEGLVRSMTTSTQDIKPKGYSGVF